MEKVIRWIIEILTAARTSASVWDPIKKVKGIFFWDPILIPLSQLPAIVVAPISDLITARGTQYDQADSTIRVKLIQNLKDDLWSSAIDQENLKLAEYAVQLMEQRDSNGKIKTVSVTGALRAQPELPYQWSSSVQWNGDYNIDYSFTDVRWYVAFETTLTLTAKTISDRL